jgi:signal transduction histidine kinase
MPLELNQVFLNLLRNAALALGQQGEIRVGTGGAADEVWVEIADNGCGIAAGDLLRIVDPFFTTWPVAIVRDRARVRRCGAIDRERALRRYFRESIPFSPPFKPPA